jgi:hypothetical protein
MSNREDWYDALKKELPPTNTRESVSSTPAPPTPVATTQDLKVIIVALEKACKLVQDLDTKVSKLEVRVSALERTTAVQNHKLEEAAFTAGAEADLNRWMIDAANEPAYEVPLSKGEIERRMAGFYDRRATAAAARAPRAPGAGQTTGPNP